MKSEQRTREKVTAELRSLFDDEAAHYAKYSRVGFRIKAAGIACIIIGAAIATSPLHWQTIAAMVFGTAGGFLAGLSVAYDASVKSWPILKPLLRHDAMEILARGGENR